MLLKVLGWLRDARHGIRYVGGKSIYDSAQVDDPTLQGFIERIEKLEQDVSVYTDTLERKE
jgi:hypothetical protein